MSYVPLDDARARLRASALRRTAEIMWANGASFAEIAEALLGGRNQARRVGRLLGIDRA